MKEFIPNYYVTRDGRIFSTACNKGMQELHPCISNHGYYRITIKQKNYSVHRIVADSFLEKTSDDLVVNHKDGNKLNNNVDNLEWCTQKENVEHAWRTGLCTSDKNYFKQAVYKVSMKDFSILSEYPSIKAAEKDNPKAKGHIASCCTGKRSNAGGYYWVYKNKYVKEEFPNTIKVKSDLTGANNPSARRVICLTTNEVFDTMKEACKKYGISPSNLSLCCRGKLKTTGGMRWKYY